MTDLAEIRAALDTLRSARHELTTYSAAHIGGQLRPDAFNAVNAARRRVLENAERWLMELMERIDKEGETP